MKKYDVILTIEKQNGEIFKINDSHLAENKAECIEFFKDFMLRNYKQLLDIKFN